MELSASAIAVCCCSASISSRGESGYLCFVISIRGTVKPHIFWRSVALALSRLATLRFCWFAACSGAPSQRWRVHADPQGELDRVAGPRVHRKLAEEFI